ncbi:cell division protein SepF [Corynebacterium epidermidicanis]|uniref:Cell division protein SepF n=1 Tax=Corynebacterium epidermidicanis TaxID=1050174 RepID=A0A0G3GQV0_9CORY|nr:cell division protein SepF [Corynebacterium epidermidicanis]AKK03514.1 hypothetical protein CEPID_08320 [Corynebacterium epidermidicanis]
MSSVRKVKEFFGLAPYEAEMDDAYYADDARYSAEPAYASVPASHGYRTEPRPYKVTVVPVRLTDYKDSRRLAEPFRDGDAVVFDMSDLHTEDARRVIDFAAGLCFALRGDMKKIDARVFAVIPENADVDVYDLKTAARIR